MTIISVFVLLFVLSALATKDKFNVNGKNNQSNNWADMTYTIKNITNFRTSMANVSVIDIILYYPYANITVAKRRMLNFEREEIVITESDLILPSGYGNKITDTKGFRVDQSRVHPGLRPVIVAPFTVGSLSTAIDDTSNVLIIGLGGSQLNNFLHYKFPKMNITIIELEKTMVDVARKYFGLKEDDHQTTLVMDGVKFIQKVAKSERKFNAIFIDACPTAYPLNNVVLCPSMTFITNNTIQYIKKALNKQGSVVIKMLLYTDAVENKAQEIAKRFESFKMNCAVSKMLNQYNRVLLCANDGIPKSRLTEKYIETQSRKIYKTINL